MFQTSHKGLKEAFNSNMMSIGGLYMVVNFRAGGISRGARKLARTPMLIIKKNQ